jgi:hypothetical protein
VLANAAAQVLGWSWTAAGRWLRVRACPAQTSVSSGTGAGALPCQGPAAGPSLRGQHSRGLGFGAGSDPVKTVAMDCCCFLAGGWGVMLLGAVRVLSWVGTLQALQAGWACHRRCCHCSEAETLAPAVAKHRHNNPHISHTKV